MGWVNINGWNCLMLLLLFKVGSRQYAIETQSVLQVFPSSLMQRSEMDLPSDAVNSQVGLLQWQTEQQVELIPVIDLSQLLMGVPCPGTIGTRIMVVKADNQVWGLMAASMVQTWRIDDELAEGESGRSGWG
jgi:chemotaxis signal transduction protein